MSLIPSFEYRRLGDFTYHLLSNPLEIKTQLTRWQLREWERDHYEAPHEHWTVEWMRLLPNLHFSLETLRLDEIRPHPDLWRLEAFQAALQARAAEREEALLRGVSIEPLVVYGQGLQLMDGYTRYVVLKRYAQSEVFAYTGHA